MPRHIGVVAIVALVLSSAATARAEYRHVDLSIFGMD